MDERLGAPCGTVIVASQMESVAVPEVLLIGSQAPAWRKLGVPVGKA